VGTGVGGGNASLWARDGTGVLLVPFFEAAPDVAVAVVVGVVDDGGDCLQSLTITGSMYPSASVTRCSASLLNTSTAFHGKPTSKLQSVTCHMESHSVSCRMGSASLLSTAVQHFVGNPPENYAASPFSLLTASHHLKGTAAFHGKPTPKLLSVTGHRDQPVSPAIWNRQVSLTYYIIRRVQLFKENRYHMYGASPAIWDHTVLPATQHRW